MKANEMRNLTIEELRKKLEEAHEDVFNLRFRLSTRQLINHCELPRAKKEIARIKTLIAEKERDIK